MNLFQVEAIEVNEPEVDCPPMPHFGNLVDISKLEARNTESKAKCAAIFEAVLGSVSVTVMDTKTIVVADNREPLLIATIISKSINTDGMNMTSLVDLNQRYSADNNNLLQHKKCVQEIMGSNYSSVEIGLQPRISDDGLSRVDLI